MEQYEHENDLHLIFVMKVDSHEPNLFSRKPPLLSRKKTKDEREVFSVQLICDIAAQQWRTCEETENE